MGRFIATATALSRPPATTADGQWSTEISPVYFQRTDGSVSGRGFTEQIQLKAPAAMKATVIAVEKAPPVYFCQPWTVGRRPS